MQNDTIKSLSGVLKVSFMSCAS